MAGVDKIYGIKKQEVEFRAWCEENMPEALNFFYEWDDEWNNDNHEHPITNFPLWIDRELKKKCPISFVQKRLKGQYGTSRKRNKEKYINRQVVFKR